MGHVTRNKRGGTVPNGGVPLTLLSFVPKPGGYNSTGIIAEKAALEPKEAFFRLKAAEREGLVESIQVPGIDTLWSLKGQGKQPDLIKGKK